MSNLHRRKWRKVLVRKIIMLHRRVILIIIVIKCSNPSNFLKVKVAIILQLENSRRFQIRAIKLRRVSLISSSAIRKRAAITERVMMRLENLLFHNNRNRCRKKMGRKEKMGKSRSRKI